ncbi:hypothetical protein EJ110_NYTH36092 [Nymphaea thermarum]|nr:hypothetical protein EJ110_NYTH36092 [Nymphaea thermarum]
MTDRIEGRISSPDKKPGKKSTLAFAETAISDLLGSVTSLLKENINFVLNAEDDLKDLKMKLEHWQKDLKDADSVPFFSNDRNRYEQLKDVVYDAEDIIEKYRNKIELSKRDKVRKRSWTAAFSSINEHIFFPYQVGKKIKKFKQSLDGIKLEPTQKEGGKGTVGGENDNSRETTHHIGLQPPIGREDDKNVIVEKLLSENSLQNNMTEKGGVSIISIVGKGGIGKTAIAKMVFSEVEQQFGKHRWWVCVSERPSREDLLRKILKEVCKGSKTGLEAITSLSDLCTQVQSELQIPNNNKMKQHVPPMHSNRSPASPTFKS